MKYMAYVQKVFGDFGFGKGRVGDNSGSDKEYFFIGKI